MPSDFNRKARELVHELQQEIQRMEGELNNKKEILERLENIGGTPVRIKRRYRRKAAVESGITRRGRRPGKRIPGRRRSANRDVVLQAARTFAGRFKLHELQAKVTSINPKFGGNHPSGTIISVLKTTPEIRKIRRGEYKYKG